MDVVAQCALIGDVQYKATAIRPRGEQASCVRCRLPCTQGTGLTRGERGCRCCRVRQGFARLGWFRGGGLRVGQSFARQLWFRGGHLPIGEGFARARGRVPVRGESQDAASPCWMKIPIHTSSSPWELFIQRALFSHC